MVVSTALGELAEILGCLEHNDIEVRNISISEQPTDDVDELRMDICAGIPVLSGIEFCDSVIIEAEDTELTEERLEVEMSVSIPTESLKKSAPIASTPRQKKSSPNIETVTSSVPGVPAYKDPEALQTVYKNYETFPQMTKALDVDVTSETVRRYMMKHGIHNPKDEKNKRKSTGSDTDDAIDSEREGITASKKNKETNYGGESVAKVLASMDQDDTTEVVRTDGIGILKDLTLREFVDVINQSRTVSEVKQRLETDYDDTRRLLTELDLLKFVTGRLSATQDDLTLAEFYQQIGLDDRLEDGTNPL
ncbi:hypothetical protein [Haladaptatus sp. NG-SE-30]